VYACNFVIILIVMQAFCCFLFLSSLISSVKLAYQSCCEVCLFYKLRYRFKIGITHLFCIIYLMLFLHHFSSLLASLVSNLRRLSCRRTHNVPWKITESRTIHVRLRKSNCIQSILVDLLIRRWIGALQSIARFLLSQRTAICWTGSCITHRPRCRTGGSVWNSVVIELECSSSKRTSCRWFKRYIVRIREAQEKVRNDDWCVGGEEAKEGEYQKV